MSRFEKAFPHQEEAHAATTAAYARGHRRVLLEMATGTGKSFTQAMLLRDVLQDDPASPAVVFVPSQDLVKQNAETYKAALGMFGIDVDVLAVFSPKEDESSGFDNEGVCDLVSTDFAKVSNRLLNNRAARRPTVVISTYQSAATIEDVATTGVRFGQMICDEAHRMASGLKEDEGGSWTKPLHDSAIPAQRRTFYTATVRGDQTKGLSMANEDLFGPQIHSLDYFEASRRGLLASMEPVVMPIELASLEPALEAAGFQPEDPEGSVKGWRQASLYAASLAATEAFVTADLEAGRTPSVIAIHPNRDVADSFAETLDSNLEAQGQSGLSFSVHGEVAHRKEEALRRGHSPNNPMVLSVVNMFTEGSDLPALDTAVLSRDIQSRVLLMQFVGRVVRRYNKRWQDEDGNIPTKSARVVIPMIVDSRDPDFVPTNTNAKAFVEFMLSADRSLRASFQESCQRKGHEEGSGVVQAGPSPEAVVAKCLNLSEDNTAFRRLAQQITAEIREKQEFGAFHEHLGRFRGFVERHGRPPRSHSPSDIESRPEHERASLRQEAALVAWQEAALTALEQRKLHPEEVAAMAETPQLSLRPKVTTSGEKLLKRFQAMEEHLLSRHTEKGLSPVDAMEKGLQGLKREALGLALMGERFDSRGRSLSRREGDMELERFGVLLSQDQERSGRLPEILRLSPGDRLSLNGTREDRVCSVTGKLLSGVVCDRHMALPYSLRVRGHQPFVALSLLGETDRRDVESVPVGQKVSLRVEVVDTDGTLKLRLSEPLQRSLEPAKEAVLSLAKGSQDVSPRAVSVKSLPPVFENLCKVLSARPVGENCSPRTLMKDPDAKAKGCEAIPGHFETNRQLNTKLAQLRLMHASGKLAPEVVERFDRLHGFSWVDPEDVHRPVPLGRNKTSNVFVEGVRRVAQRHPEVFAQSTTFSQDTAVSNTVRWAAALPETMDKLNRLKPEDLDAGPVRSVFAPGKVLDRGQIRDLRSLLKTTFREESDTFMKARSLRSEAMLAARSLSSSSRSSEAPLRA